MRNPGKRLLALAREQVVFQPGSATATLSRLTPDQELDRQFPGRDAKTPYGFFSRTDDTEVVVCFTGAVSETERARVILEAALGMKDNPLFD